MEKLPHQDYRDTLAEHLKGENKDKRKEILDGAQDTEKYKDAELKKFLTQPSVDFFDKYKELEIERSKLRNKKWTLAEGIGVKEIGKYEEKIELLDDEIHWMDRVGAIEHYDRGADRSYNYISTEDKDMGKQVSKLMERQIKKLKSVFEEVDIGVFKKIEDHLIEDEERFKREIEKPIAEGEDQVALESKISRLKEDLKETQYYLKYHIVPPERVLRRYFPDINEQEGSQTAVSSQGSVE